MKLILSLTLFIFCTIFYECSGDTNDLIAVVQVFRHGQRTPISFYPTDPYANRSFWPVNPGQLTNEGKRQLYDLGKYTRERYNDFLPTKYNNEDFYAQTTDVDRTHMSAQSFLAALYSPDPEQEWNPNLKWQPIPVHPMDGKVFSWGSSCPMFALILTDLLVDDDFFAALNKQYAEAYSHITLHSGLIVTTVSAGSDIYDVLHIEDIFNYTLPEWTNSVYPEPLASMSGYLFQSLGYTDRLKQLTVGYWLHEVTEYFDNILNDTSSTQKYQVFSGHDTNIATILNTFGVVTKHAPDFASTIFLELRKINDDVVVNILHRNGNDDINQVTLPGCEFDCKLEDFKAVLKTWTIDAATWTRHCYTPNENISINENSPLFLSVKEFLKSRN